MKNAEFASELNKMELVHLLNFEMTSSEELNEIFIHQEISNDDATMAISAYSDNPARIDKVLYEIGWGMNSFEMLQKENSALAKSLANRWEIKANEIPKSDKLGLVRVLDLSLLFDPSNTGSSCHLAQIFAEAGACELLNREAKFFYYHLYKQREENSELPNGLSIQRWKRIKQMGMQIDAGNTLYSDDNYNFDVPASACEKQKRLKVAINLLRETGKVQRPAGEELNSVDESLGMHVCDRKLFEKRVTGEGEKERKQQLNELAGIVNVKRLPFIPKTVFEKIKQIGKDQPNFHEATELILDTLYAQHLSGMPACLPPLLMYGAPALARHVM